MITQLSLLDYQPPPEESLPPPIEISPPIQRTLLAWHECQVEHYLTLILRIQSGKLPSTVKMTEIKRLYTLRQQALSKIAEIEQRSRPPIDDWRIGS